MKYYSLRITMFVLIWVLFLSVPFVCAETAEEYFNSALTYANQSNFTQAISDCTKAIETNPKYADAYNVRGAVYEHQSNLSQAISDYTKAITINPNYAKAYCNRGGAYDKQGNFAQAILDLTKAIGIDPNDAASYNNLGVAYYVIKDYDKAWENVHKAEKLGYTVNPAFLVKLKKASVRDK